MGGRPVSIATTSMGNMAFYNADKDNHREIVLHLLSKNYDWKNLAVWDQFQLLKLAMKYNWESHKDKVVIDMKKEHEDGNTILVFSWEVGKLDMIDEIPSQVPTPAARQSGAR